MAEHGLTATVIPEIDDEGMRKFINQITDSLVDISLPINFGGSQSSSTAQSSTAENVAPDRNERVSEQAESVTKGMIDFANNNPTEIEALAKPVTDEIVRNTSATSPIAEVVDSSSEKFVTNIGGLKNSILDINTILSQIEADNDSAKQTIELRNSLNAIMSEMEKANDKIDFTVINRELTNIDALTSTMLTNLTSDQTDLMNSLAEIRSKIIDIKNGEAKSEDTQGKNVLGNKILGVVEKFGLNFDVFSEKNMGDMTELIGKILPEGMGAIAGSVATGIGVVLVIQDAVEKFMTMLVDSSPALKNVMGLIDTAVNLILMPIGTTLAVQLMPVVYDMFAILTEWMSEAGEIYEKEGWYGLIKEAVNVALKMLWVWMDEYLPVIGGMFYEIIDGFLTSDFAKRWLTSLYLIWEVIDLLLVPMFRGTIEQLTTLSDPIVKFLSKLRFDSLEDFIQSFVEGFTTGEHSIGEILKDTFLAFYKYFEWDKIFEFFVNVVDPIGIMTAVTGQVINLFKDEEFKKNISDGFNAIGELISGWDWTWLSTLMDNVLSLFFDKRTVKQIQETLNDIGDEWAKFTDNPVGYTGNALEEYTFPGLVYKGVTTGEWRNEFTDAVGGFVGGLVPHADGGIALGPSAGIIGEAGPEAIVPLDKFGEVVSQYQSTTNNVDYGSPINLYVYINGATDPVTVGNTVIHQFEKVVGKSASKIKRWG